MPHYLSAKFGVLSPKAKRETVVTNWIVLKSEFVGCFVGSVVEDRAATFSTRFMY